MKAEPHAFEDRDAVDDTATSGGWGAASGKGSDAMEITGKLRRNERGRWEIVDDDERTLELTTGNIIEVQVGEHWVRTRIEFDDTPWPGRPTGDYYAITPGVLLCVGLSVRAVQSR
jgi:hypothetical protein